MLNVNFDYRWIVGPTLIFLFLAPFTPWIDLKASQYFYHFQRETFSDNVFFNFLFTYGEMPALIIAFLSFFGWVFTYIYKNWRSLRVPFLVLWLTYVIVAGFFVNLFFKEHWGRPRPREVAQFGGTKSFHPFYSPDFILINHQSISKSFPSGHASVGFYFFTFAFLGLELKKNWLFWLGIITGALMGTLLGLARIAQGGHFVSDVLGAAWLMWTFGYLITFSFNWKKNYFKHDSTHKKTA